MRIHSTAIVDPGAELAGDTEIGPYSIIEAGVMIQSGCKIGPHVLLASGACLGKNIQVFKGAVIGTAPQDLKFRDQPTVAIVEDGTIVREFTTIHRGTDATGQTVVGRDCMLMAYSHVAHDCVLEDKVVMANSVNLGGHVHIEEQAVIGGVVPVHQFVRIGCHSMIAGGTRVPKDVPPFILAANEPLRFNGLNSIGLRRRGFSAQRISEIKHAYKLIYLSDLNVSQGIARIKEEMNISPDVQHIIDFIQGSERGII